LFSRGVSLNFFGGVILLFCQGLWGVGGGGDRNGSHFARDSKGIPEARVWNSRKVTLCALVEYLVIT